MWLRCSAPERGPNLPMLQLPTTSKHQAVTIRWDQSISKKRQKLRTKRLGEKLGLSQEWKTIYCRGPSIINSRCLYLEQFTSARHFYTFDACLPVTPQDLPFYHFLSESLTMYSACAVTPRHFGHFNHSHYLLTMKQADSRTRITAWG